MLVDRWGRRSSPRRSWIGCSKLYAEESYMQFRTTRRGLFGGTAAALASWKLGTAATTPAAHSEVLKLGVASYSFRKFSRADMIKGLQTLGIKYVNVKDVHLPMAASMAEI